MGQSAEKMAVNKRRGKSPLRLSKDLGSRKNRSPLFLCPATTAKLTQIQSPKGAFPSSLFFAPFQT